MEWLTSADQNKLEILLRAADYLMLEELSIAVENHLIEHINVESLLSVWNLGCTLQSETTCETCIRYFVNNFTLCVNSDGFFDLPHEFIRKSLHTGELTNSTSTVIEAIDRWAHKQSDDPITVKKLLYELMPPSTMFNKEIRQMVLGFPLSGPGDLPAMFFK